MLVIGIAGPSCSGKSTVSNAVARELTAPVVCLDYQYDRDLPHMFTDGVRTFERPELYRGDELARISRELAQDGHSTFKELKHRVEKTITLSASDYLILEGFILYQYESIRKICDLMFYIDVPWDEMVRRRTARPTEPKTDEAFFKIGKIETQTYVEPQKKMPKVIVLDGTQSTDSIAQQIVQRVLNEK